MYDKVRQLGYFKQHILRSALYHVWDKLKFKMYPQLPKWIRPLEIATNPNWIEKKQNRTYNDLLDGNNELRSKETLEQQGIHKRMG